MKNLKLFIITLISLLTILLVTPLSAQENACDDIFCMVTGTLTYLDDVILITDETTDNVFIVAPSSNINPDDYQGLGVDTQATVTGFVVREISSSTIMIHADTIELVQEPPPVSDEDSDNQDNDEESDDEEDQDNNGFYCRNREVEHPTGGRLAETYADVTTYAEVIAMHCDENMGFGQISKALDQREDDGIDDAFYCENRDVKHPIGGQLASDYADVTTYADVITWYCDDNQDFEQIRLLLHAIAGEGFYCRNRNVKHPTGEELADEYADVTTYAEIIAMHCDENLEFEQIRLVLDAIPDDGDDNDNQDDEGFYCRNRDVEHPRGGQLADDYADVTTYAEVIAMHCDENMGFGQIRNLLEQRIDDGETDENNGRGNGNGNGNNGNGNGNNGNGNGNNGNGRGNGGNGNNGNN